jgi:2-desacetyl-2-hydroxyethyl bacteriochlorophyllide A dehydrogenase
MRALVWTGPRSMEMRTVDDPVPGPGEVLIEVAYSGICGSELGGYLGHNSLRVPPLIMGHEFSGVIADAGPGVSQQALPEGAEVTVNPIIAGEGSRAAIEGRANLSRRREILGIHRPGSFARLIVAPANQTYVLPNGLSLEMAALTEPMGCAIRAAAHACVGPTDTVMVAGLGPIGLLTAQVLKESGVRTVIATDIDPYRRSMGEALGFHVLDPSAGDPVEQVLSLTNGEGVSAAVDAVGADITRTQCIRCVRWGGTVVFVGLHEEASEVPANYVIRSEITIQGSFAYAPKDFEDALQWLADGRAPVRPWIEHAPLEEGGDCFERLLGEPGPVLKILLDS